MFFSKSLFTIHDVFLPEAKAVAICLSLFLPFYFSESFVTIREVVLPGAKSVAIVLIANPVHFFFQSQC